MCIRDRAWCRSNEENLSRCAYNDHNGVGTVVNAITVANANTTAQNPKPSLRRSCSGEMVEEVIGLSVQLKWKIGAIAQPRISQVWIAINAKRCLRLSPLAIDSGCGATTARHFRRGRRGGQL